MSFHQITTQVQDQDHHSQSLSQSLTTSAKLLPLSQGQALSSSLSHDDDLFARQLELEKEMADKGRERYFSHVAKAQENHRESNTSYGVTLMKSGILPVAKELDALIERTKTGGAGRRHTIFNVIKDADTKAVAFIALRKFLDVLSDTYRPLTQTALFIGRAVELELKLGHLKDVDLERYKITKHFLKENHSARHRERVLKYAFGKSQLVTFKPLKENEVIQVGVQLLDVIQRTLGLFEKELVRAKPTSKHLSYIISPTPKLLEWIDKHKEIVSFHNPDYLPMLLPPQPWTNTTDGGYYSEHLPSFSLVKVRDKDFLEQVQEQIDKGKMNEVLQSLNALQGTAWKVNNVVHEVASHLWDKTSADTAGLPPKERLSLPVCPLCGANLDNCKIVEHECFTIMSEEQVKEWKKQARRIHNLNASLLSKQLVVAKTLILAQRFTKEESLYYPYQLDFRGRIYAIPSYLTPQGTDLAKGLLTFAKGIPLGTEEAAQWLAIHGANTYGIDKVSFDDRLSWVKDNEDKILATAQDPYSHKWWHDADSPFCFLAFCFEWAGYKEQGLAYASSLPIAMDGTCNGLQIYSLLLKDEIGGQAVNLIPQDKPQDIYGIVAEKVKERVKADAQCNPSESSVFTKKDPTKELYNSAICAKFFEHMPIDRKTTKRQVMVLPYGGTFDSCKDYTIEWVRDNISKVETPMPQGYDVPKLSHYLAKNVWEGIGNTVTKAPEAMQFLQQTANVANSVNKPIIWETPSGLPVKQGYTKLKDKSVMTHLGEQISLQIHDNIPDTVNKVKQKNSIAPNFVHSLDASALMHTILLAQAKGIHAFAMIHDSYGTHAAHTATLAKTLRESFVELFNGEKNLLSKWQEDVLYHLGDDANFISKDALPKLPSMGALDIEQLKHSQFFFA